MAAFVPLSDTARTALGFRLNTFDADGSSCDTTDPKLRAALVVSVASYYHAYWNQYAATLDIPATLLESVTAEVVVEPFGCTVTNVRFAFLTPLHTSFLQNFRHALAAQTSVADAVRTPTATNPARTTTSWAALHTLQAVVR